MATLCIADKLNILDSIAAIARSIHRGERTDFVMPYVSIPKPRQPQPKSATAEQSESSGTICAGASGHELGTMGEISSHDDTHQKEEASQRTDAGQLIVPGGPMSPNVFEVIRNYDLILPSCQSGRKVEHCETTCGDGDSGGGGGLMAVASLRVSFN